MISEMSRENIALYEDEGISRFICAMCGEEGFAEFPYEKMGTCAGCVRSLAHSYVMSHGGEPDPRFCSDEEFVALASERCRSARYSKVPIPYSIRKAVLERDAYRCQMCGDHHNLHVDHIFPESKGGEATLENLQCLCAPLQHQKGSAGMSTPWMKFFPSDWRADPALRMCSVGARGLWMEMLCIMHEADPYGSLRVNGRPVSDRQMASLAGASEKDAATWIAELEDAGVFSRDDDGAIISRRMLRDNAKAAADKANGRRGGNPKLRKGVNPPDNPQGNPPVDGGDKAQKPEARSQKETTPSGVVSAAPPLGSADEIQSKLLDAIGDGNIHPHGCIDLSAILGLIKAGVDLETDILPTIRARAAKLRRPVGSWAYFTEAIRDAYNRRIEAGQGLSQPKKVAPIKPDADMSAEELRAAWQKRLNYGRAYRSWPEFWGPMPGQPGCTAPPDMLEPKDGHHPDGSPWDIQRIEAA